MSSTTVMARRRPVTRRNRRGPLSWGDQVAVCRVSTASEATELRRMVGELAGDWQQPGPGHKIALLAYAPTVAGCLLAHDTDGGVEIVRLYVRPCLRGTGVADALLQRLRQGAEARGTAAVQVSVSPQEARARAFYRRHGFEPAPGGPDGQVTFRLAL